MLANKGTTYIEIQWGRPTGGLSAYKVRYKKVDDPNYSSETTIEKEQTTFQIDQLTGGVEYQIQIRSVSNAEHSMYALISITTGRHIQVTLLCESCYMLSDIILSDIVITFVLERLNLC